jgi:hypothetical protein
MASNVSNKHLIGFEAGLTTRKRLALDGNAVPRPPTSATDEESDNGSVFKTSAIKAEAVIHVSVLIANTSATIGQRPQ